MNRATQFLSTHFCKVPELSVSSRFLSWSTKIGDILLKTTAPVPKRVCTCILVVYIHELLTFDNEKQKKKVYPVTSIHFL